MLLIPGEREVVIKRLSIVISLGPLALEVNPHYSRFFVDILIIDIFVNLVGMEDVTRRPAGSLARNYEATAVRRILGDNLLRVFRQVGG